MIIGEAKELGAEAPNEGAPQRSITTILGAQGMGKSTLARELAANYIAHERRRGVKPNVIAIDPNLRWEGAFFPPEAHEDSAALVDLVRKITGGGRGPPFSEMVDRRGALLILDDADTFFDAGMPYKPWKPVWQRNRHLRLSIILIGHRSQDIPKLAIAMSSRLYLFAMEEPGCLEYLARVPAIGRDVLRQKLPTRPGLALEITTRPERKNRVVDVFGVINRRQQKQKSTTGEAP